MRDNKNIGEDFKVSLNKDEQVAVEQSAKRHNLAFADYLRQVALSPQKFITATPGGTGSLTKQERISVSVELTPLGERSVELLAVYV